MRSSGTWSDNTDQVNIHVYSVEVRYLSIMSIGENLNRKLHCIYIMYLRASKDINEPAFTRRLIDASALLSVLTFYVVLVLGVFAVSVYIF